MQAFDLDCDTGKIELRDAYLNANIIARGIRSGSHNTEVEILLASYPAPWLRVVRKEFLIRNQILFQNLKYQNDVSFYVQTVLLSKRISVLQFPLVIHRRGVPSSLTQLSRHSGLHLIQALSESNKSLSRRIPDWTSSLERKAFLLFAIHQALGRAVASGRSTSRQIRIQIGLFHKNVLGISAMDVLALRRPLVGIAFIAFSAGLGSQQLQTLNAARRALLRPQS